MEIVGNRRKTSILDVPRKENKILGQTLNKSIDGIGAQQEEKKKILGQTWQENINPGCAQKGKQDPVQTLKKNIDHRGAQ